MVILYTVNIGSVRKIKPVSVIPEDASLQRERDMQVMLGIIKF